MQGNGRNLPRRFNVLGCTWHKLGPHDRNVPRRLDAQPHLTAAQSDDCYTNVTADEKFLRYSASQYQHETTPQP